MAIMRKPSAPGNWPFLGLPGVPIDTSGDLTVMLRFRMEIGGVASFEDLFLLSESFTTAVTDPYLSSYFWVGLMNTGANGLLMEKYTPGPETYTQDPASPGLSLSTGVDYTVAYVKAGDTHSLLLWSGNGTYDFDVIGTFTEAGMPAAMYLFLGAISHQVARDVLRIWTAELTEAELRLEHADFYPVRMDDLFANWALITATEDSLMELVEPEYTSTHQNPLQFVDPYANGLGTVDGLSSTAWGPVRADQIAYQEDWSSGSSPEMTGNGTGFHWANTFAAIEGTFPGADTPDSVYPEYVMYDNIDVIGGVLSSSDTDLQNSALYVMGMGNRSSPLSDGWVDANKGRVLVRAQLTTAAWANAALRASLFNFWNRTSSVSSPLFELYWDNLGSDVGRFEIKFSRWGISYPSDGTHVTGSITTKAATENAWQEFDVRWRCGTVTLSPTGISSVASDGYLQVFWRNGAGAWERIFLFTEIPLVHNRGWDNQPNGSMVGVPSFTPEVVNWQRFMMIGNYGRLPEDEITVWSDSEPVIVFDPAQIRWSVVQYVAPRVAL